MLRIENITNNPKQDFDITLADRTRLFLQMRYRPSQERWNATFIYKNRELDVMLTTTVNLVDVWSNFVDFGVACLAVDGEDPFKLSDFTPTKRRGARCRLYISNASELTELKNALYGS